MPGDGVSLTPVNAQGQPLGGSEGVQEGASVLYANTQTDTDTLAKPTTGGFEIDSLLRSVDSPETLYFKVGYAGGSKACERRKAPGGARVVLGARRSRTIAPGERRTRRGRMCRCEMELVWGHCWSRPEHDWANTSIRSTSILKRMTKPQRCDENEPSLSMRKLHRRNRLALHATRRETFKAPYSTGYGYVMSTPGGHR